VTFNTFSVVARCPRTGDFGVAVATARPAVGAVVPWVSDTGAVATQAKTNTEHGRRALALLAAGQTLAVALPRLLDADPERDHRQVHGIDGHGTFAFTGPQCQPWCGDRTGSGFSVAGNLLAGPEVLDAMVASLTSSIALELPERLVRALEAAQGAGGDRRGKQSAALLIAAAEPRPYHNLRVDDHVDPVAELRRLHDLSVAHAATLLRDYGAEGLRLYRRVKS
jgi:uncharacterized Ntn-hydrolase superfamily protein